MQYNIVGSTMQSLYIKLSNHQEGIYSESGCLLYMTPNIQLQTSGTGGIGGMFKRWITGNSVFLNHFQLSQGNEGEVVFTTRFPGHIIPLDLHGREIFVQRHSFLCAEESVQLEPQPAFNGIGLFGGNGLVFNKLSGTGQAFISVDGETIEKELGYGESILVHPGHLAAYEEGVGVELQRQIGFKNMFLSGDGIFLLRLSGPGKILLHSLSIHNLAGAISEFLPSRGSNS